jgi:hypothetical protein
MDIAKTNIGTYHSEDYSSTESDVELCTRMINSAQTRSCMMVLQKCSLNNKYLYDVIYNVIIFCFLKCLN